MSHYIAAYATPETIAEYQRSYTSPEAKELYNALYARDAFSGVSGAGVYHEYDAEAIEKGINHLSDYNGSNEAMQFLITCLKEAKESGQVLIYFG